MPIGSNSDAMAAFLDAQADLTQMDPMQVDPPPPSSRSGDGDIELGYDEEDIKVGDYEAPEPTPQQS